MGCHRLGDLKIVRLAQPNVWYIDNASTVTSVNRTLFSVPNYFVYLITPEMRTPHYSGHFKLTQWCPV